MTNSPPRSQLFPRQIEMVVPKLKRLGTIDRFFTCGNSSCQKKSNVFGSSEEAVQCESCQGWSLKESLLETVMVKMYVEREG